MSLNRSRFDQAKELLPESLAEIVIMKQPNISLDIESGSGFPGTSVNLSSYSGTLYVTSLRIVYVPVNQTNFFQSFECDILSIEITKVIESLFASPKYSASIVAVPNGGLRSPAKMTLGFKDGGASSFLMFLKEQAANLQKTMVQDHGEEEPLPLYEETTTGPSVKCQDDLPSYE